MDFIHIHRYIVVLKSIRIEQKVTCLFGHQKCDLDKLKVH